MRAPAPQRGETEGGNAKDPVVTGVSVLDLKPMSSVKLAADAATVEAYGTKLGSKKGLFGASWSRRKFVIDAGECTLSLGVNC